jgi:lipid-A-disaccharide synthase
MKPKSFMVIAGEPSGDLLAAELVQALRDELTTLDATPTTDYQPLRTGLEPRFFGAGGPRMTAAGVEVALDLTAHSVIGLSEALKHYFKFRRFFHQLYQLARERQPDAVICVDFSGFNRRFAQALRHGTRPRADWFHDWQPKIIQYVSPQVWASREGRAYQMAKDYDLLLSIFPFERDWYARRVPQLRVEFVGHPILERHADAECGARAAEPGVAPASTRPPPSSPNILLLPGSRAGELTRHLPVLMGALASVRATFPHLRARMVLPHEPLAQQARASGLTANVEIQTGGLSSALSEADVAIASTGTVTMECAYFGVPTVALYKTSWSTWQIAKRIVKVKYGAMPNLLANAEIFPEFIQENASAENIARATLELLRDEKRRAEVKAKLSEVIASLGGPGASRRAARAITRLLDTGI